MFSICKQTHPATAVEHAISCYFFDRSNKCLVTAGANLLKVYRLVPDPEVNVKLERAKKRRNEPRDWLSHRALLYPPFFMQKSSHLESESIPPKCKLECIATYTLFGNVMSLQSVNLGNSPRDALLLAFEDAKLSVVEYDPEAHDLRTLSLHYFEEDDMKDGWTHHHHVPLIRADPENRCAVMTIFGRKLVVLPFRRETALDDGDANDIKPMIHTATSSKSLIMASYMIYLKEFMDKIDNVIDIQFLHGYYEPTLLILYEPLKTFTGYVFDGFMR